jgi:hypothetical protein
LKGNDEVGTIQNTKYRDDISSGDIKNEHNIKIKWLAERRVVSYCITEIDNYVFLRHFLLTSVVVYWQTIAMSTTSVVA